MRFVLLIAAAGLCACAAADVADDDSFDDSVPIDPYREPPPLFEPTSEEDAGAFQVPERPRPDGGSKPPPPADSGSSEPDAGPPPACAPIAPGSLILVELMIKQIDGAGDGAEWVELQNPNECTLTVPAGLRILSPRGASVNDVATVATAFELPPHAQFVAGGASAPSHAELPTIRWSTLDTLKNTGDSVRVELGDGAETLVIDTLTYPSFSNLFAARSLAFPSDCPAAARATFSNWSGSFADYPPGPLVGTPFTPNDDVTCAP